MKAIRSIAMLAALALLCTLPAMAQEGGQSKPEGGGQAKGEGAQAGGPRRMMSPEERLKRMTDQLSLSQEQRDKIKPILEDNQKQMQALRDNGGSMEDNREKGMKLRSETNDKIKAVLNDDQKKKFEEMNQRGPMGGGARREGGEKPHGEGGEKPPQ